jgi:hypothetical protein
MNKLTQHIFSKCKVLPLAPEPFLYGSINKAKKQGLVVCDLDFSSSDWLNSNCDLFKNEKITWIAYNSKADQLGIFHVAQNFMYQKVESESIDFQGLNYPCSDSLDLEFFQKVAYCSKSDGRFIARDILWLNKGNQDYFEKEKLSELIDLSDESLHKMAIDSGFSKCVISRKSHSLFISNLFDYEKWIKRLIVLLDKDENSFKGFSSKELKSKEFELDFLENQEIIIREIFAIK